MMTNIRSTGIFALATLLTATTAFAQAPAAPSPEATSVTSFEVASIRPSPPGDPSNPLSIIPLATPRPGGRFTATNVPLWSLIATAWELPDFRIVGGNKELLNTKYHVTAKSSGGATLGLKQTLPLLKTLIVERFQLKFHVEPREMSHYDLVLARSDGRLGPELKPSKSDCSNEDELNAQRGDALAKGDLAALVPKPGEFLACTFAPNLAGGPTNLSLHGDGQEIKTLADVLSQFTGKYVRDKTGLTGRYDFDMKPQPARRRARLSVRSPNGHFDFSASALDVYPAASQGFHFSIALTLPSQPPSAGFTNVPLASLAHPSPPPGRPSLIGQYETVTVAPGSKVAPVMPLVSSDGGAEPSKLQSVSLPSAFLTFR